MVIVLLVMLLQNYFLRIEMAETATNTPIDSETWINVREVSCSPISADLLIQNIGVTDLYYSTKASQPARDSGSYRIFRRSDTIKIARSSIDTWVFSPQVDGLINIECLDFENALNENELTLIDQNCEIITLMKAALLGIEIIADQEEGTLLANAQEE